MIQCVLKTKEFENKTKNKKTVKINRFVNCLQVKEKQEAFGQRLKMWCVRILVENIKKLTKLINRL